MDFEAHRDHLIGVAYRMLGSLADAEDAVQETWLRMARTDTAEVRNPAGWLRTVLSRVCLDVLRQRARHEPEADPDPAPGADREVLLADEVGRALLVVLDRLGPDERVAFVLHDVFAVPFDEIAPIVGRTTATAKKLASRARAKVRGAAPGPDTAGHRRVIEAFLAASRTGDLDAIVAVLSPDVVRRADGRPEVRGARRVAEEIVVFGRNARFADFALLDGEPGLVIAPDGRLRLAIRFTLDGERVAGYELITEPARLERITLTLG
ncbi:MULTISPECIES: sigma-70 family RNA polymerase sigma factor [Amycolatopsis]|uniref:sigma-70 family RNA polymerase sigma factor n=1 Tax=Amycolatopsis TaxID=1813 RepID=UPI000B8B0E4E|nr:MULTISPECIES: sigma-70 family RNA polymerase sigma factor [Amycolatopsis]OXM67516.1 RNA polymerase subunit sigma-70 [Amycolatopsis sp. KNN50.9b]